MSRSSLVTNAGSAHHPHSGLIIMATPERTHLCGSLSSLSILMSASVTKVGPREEFT